jgi:hypothetical protein
MARGREGESERERKCERESVCVRKKGGRGRGGLKY